MLPKHPDTQHAKPDSGRNPDTQETLLEAELEKAGLHLCRKVVPASGLHYH